VNLRHTDVGRWGRGLTAEEVKKAVWLEPTGNLNSTGGIRLAFIMRNGALLCAPVRLPYTKLAIPRLAYVAATYRTVRGLEEGNLSGGSLPQVCAEAVAECYLGDSLRKNLLRIDFSKLY
jgi:hypothetical protein